LQAALTLEPPAPKGEGTEPSIHTTSPDVEKPPRKSAAASDRPGSDREQLSMKAAKMRPEGRFPKGSGWA